MAKPTKEQVQNMEAVHKRQFADLVAVTGLWHQQAADLEKKYGKNIPQSEVKVMLDFGKKTIVPLVQKWLIRQAKFDKAGAKIFDQPIKPTDWFDRKNFNKLQSIVQQIDAENRATSGIGFVPLIIWAVIAIVGFFTAEEIVDEMNDTAEEQTQLVTATNKFCVDNKLTPAQCKAMLEQQTNASSGGGGMGSKLLWAGLGIGALFLGYNYLKNQNKKAA